MSAECEGGCRLQAFLNVATGGFGTELTVKTDEDLKNKLGGTAYLFTGEAPCLLDSMGCCSCSHAHLQFLS